MNYQELEGIGLSKNEIAVYVALLKIGQSSTGSIIRESKISAGKVYVVLDKLIEKGLVSYVVKNNVKYYSGSDPKKLKEYVGKLKEEIAKKEASIDKLIPNLSGLIGSKRGEYSVEVFEGFEGFVSAWKILLDNMEAGDFMLQIGGSGYREKRIDIFYDQLNNMANAKKVGSKMIVSDVSKESIKRLKDWGFKYRTFEGFYLAPLLVGGDISLIFNFEELSVVMIRNKVIAKQFRFLFDSFWKIAKP